MMRRDGQQKGSSGFVL